MEKIDPRCDNKIQDFMKYKDPRVLGDCYKFPSTTEINVSEKLL